MSIGTEHASKHERRAGLALIAAAFLCLAGTGGLLWWRYGGVIFNDLVLTALAWCF